MSGIFQGLYGTFVKRNAVFLSTIFVGAFVTNIVFDLGMNAIWDKVNEGRQWKDIKHRYMGHDEEEGGDDDE